MIFANTYVSNFEGAFRGLRNPLESWSKSDSLFGIDSTEYCDADYEVAGHWEEVNYGYDFDEEYDKYYEQSEKYAEWLRKNGVLKLNHDCCEYAFIGPKDMDLAQRMIKAGTSDRKFLRQIFVSVDITAPLYWWKEADTYKIGTVANSTSTMHKLASTPITIDCFETDDYKNNLILYDNIEEDKDGVYNYFVDDFAKETIKHLETLRLKYLETKDKAYWKELIRWLPSSWLQTRTMTFNYEVLRNIYFQRKHHKLTEWRQFCNWIETLPYSDYLITYN